MNNYSIISEVLALVGREEEITDNEVRLRVQKRIQLAISDFESGTFLPFFLQRRSPDPNDINANPGQGQFSDESSPLILSAGEYKVLLPRSFIMEVEEERLKLVKSTDNSESFPIKKTQEIVDGELSDSLYVPAIPTAYTIGTRWDDISAVELGLGGLGDPEMGGGGGGILLHFEGGFEIRFNRVADVDYTVRLWYYAQSYEKGGSEDWFQDSASMEHIWAKYAPKLLILQAAADFAKFEMQNFTLGRELERDSRQQRLQLYNQAIAVQTQNLIMNLTEGNVR